MISRIRKKKAQQGLDDAITDIHKVGQWAWGTGRMFHVVHIGEMSEANCKDYLYYSANDSVIMP